MKCGQYVILMFDKEQNLLDAITEARGIGMKVEDVYTPYVVRGMNEAMGFKTSRLKWVAFILGAIGLLLAAGFQIWATTVDWPMNIGGKPFNAFPAYVPVMFELMVLFAGLGIVAAFFIADRLIPGKKANLLAPRSSDDWFTLVLDVFDCAFERDSYHEIFRKFNPVEVRDVTVGEDDK